MLISEVELQPGNRANTRPFKRVSIGIRNHEQIEISTPRLRSGARTEQKNAGRPGKNLGDHGANRMNRPGAEP